MITPYITTNPVGDMYRSTTWYKDVPIKVQDYAMYANLIVIDMIDYDIILGIKLLSTHHKVEYQKKRMRFQPLKAMCFECCLTVIANDVIF